MARSPVAEPAREAGPMVPVPYRVARRRRETHDSWTLELEPARRRGGRAARPRPVRDALRVRQGRGADLGQRAAARPHDPRRRHGQRRAVRRAPRRRARRARPVRHGVAGRGGRGRRRRRAHRRHRARAAAAGRPPPARAPRALRPRRRALRRPLPRGAALHRRARALARALRRRGRGRRRPGGGRLARARRRGHDAGAARGLRPRPHRRDDLRARGDDALRGRRAARTAACRPRRSTCRSSAA